MRDEADLPWNLSTGLDHSKIKVLAVDDQPQNLVALESTLESMPVELIKVTSGEDALKYLLTQDVALILMDVQMPDMDGFETAALIRQRERTRHVPIVFLTGSYQDMHMKGYSLGAVDYLLKPLLPEILKAKIAAFVELFRRTEQIRLQEQKLRYRAEEALSATEANYRLLFDNNPLPMWVYDLETLSFLVVNDAAASHYGYSREEFLSMTIKDVRLAEDIPALLDNLAKLRTFDSSVWKHRRKDGTLIDVEVIGHDIKFGRRRDRLVLMAFSRMGRTEMMTSSVDLQSLVRQVVNALDRSAEDRSTKWIIGELPEVKGDPAMLRVVLVNLISNALKFTTECSDPQIEISVYNKNGADRNETVFYVRDNGGGFDMEYAHKLFDVFQRLHSHEEFEGTGVGLATVRRVIHRHGGRTCAEGAVGQGATFYCSLPRQKNTGNDK